MAYLIISDSEPLNRQSVLKISSAQDIRYLYETDVEETEGNIYQIIDESGVLQQNGAIVLNNIPISDTGKASFEKRFLARARAIEDTPGFITIKVLRPLSDNTYVVLTQWESEQAFRDWQSSAAYNKAHKRRHTAEGLDQQPGVLSNKPYHKVYQIIN